MKLIRKFTVVSTITVGVAMLPSLAGAQTSRDTTLVRKDTVVTVTEDTVVHVKQDTAVVTTTVTTAQTPSMPRGTTVGAALARMPNYKTFASLLEYAHLMPSLRGAAPVTVFAPTDDAFARLQPDEISELKADTVRLRQLLLNHIVSGKIDTREILKLKTATTLRGTHVRLGYSDGHPTVNDEPIVQPGIMGSNGFIYGISGVLNADKH